MKYVVSVDQSTQGTKALVFDGAGNIVSRAGAAHRQIVDSRGWVEHDPAEIYRNAVGAVRRAVREGGIEARDIAAVGISNQRETAVVWDRATGEPVYNAIVWQCARGADICRGIAEKGRTEYVKSATGLPLSPYFSAAKFAWILQNVGGCAEKAARGELCCGTVDAWLIFNLTGGKAFKTDYSNASRTQLFNLAGLGWDEELCALFGVPVSALPEVCHSDGLFGYAEGVLDAPVPIRAALGDSHAALFAQGCLREGMIKATYGTGSSIMMNLGAAPRFSGGGAATSLAWGIGGTVSYVLECNINYTGAVVTWLRDDMGLIKTPAESEELAAAADPSDRTYLVPAFSGLGAPYWESGAAATITGMTRTTGRREIIRAALESVGYQVRDGIEAMREAAGLPITELRADGGPTKNAFLMQFSSDILGVPIAVSETEELSAAGAAFAAGLAAGVFDKETIFDTVKRRAVRPEMDGAARAEKYAGWQSAVALTLAAAGGGNGKKPL